MSKKGLFFKIFGQAVKDKSPEEIERLAMDAAAAMDAEEPEAEKTGPENKTDPKEEHEEKEEKKTPTKDAAFLDALDKKVDKLLAIFDEAAKEEEKDPMDEAIASLEGTKDEDPEKEEEKKGDAKVVPAEEMDGKSSEGMDKAVALGILKAMRPTVAAIQDPVQRQAVSDALIKLVTTNDSKSDISAILNASRANAKNAADKAPVMDVDQCQAAYDARNPHKRKENN